MIQQLLQIFNREILQLTSMEMKIYVSNLYMLTDLGRPFG